MVLRRTSRPQERRVMKQQQVDGNASRELTFRSLMAGLRARESLDAEEIQELADTLSRLWRERNQQYYVRMSRARKMLDSMLDGEEAQVLSTVDSISSENREVLTTVDSTTPETEATEKGEKKIPPSPPIRKGPKRNPPIACARACEEADFGHLFDEFWAKYPKECPRKVGKKKCRAKYALLMRNAKDSTALHAAILARLNARPCRPVECPLFAAKEGGAA